METTVVQKIEEDTAIARQKRTRKRRTYLAIGLLDIGTAIVYYMYGLPVWLVPLYISLSLIYFSFAFFFKLGRVD